jgi:hypothetical protein
LKSKTITLQFNSNYAILKGKTMNIYYFKTSSGRMPVQDYINDLPSADRVLIAGDLQLIRECGIMKAPVMTGDSLVLLHACKKQKQGAQRGDVDLAHKRMKEVLP